MRAWLLLVLAASATAAQAAGYDDFSRGINANNAGNSDLAISSFTAALASADLAPAYVPDAHLGRARAYLLKGKCPEALADVEQAVGLRPNDFTAYQLRAGANLCLRKPDAAQADFDVLTRMRPSASLYEGEARFEWNYGRFAEAAPNFLKAIELTPENSEHGPYIVLWYAMSADLAGSLDQAKLNDAASKFGSRSWPGPLLDLYRGRTTAEEAIKKAEDRNPQTTTNQKCEANFYVAEWYLARKNPDAAKPLLTQAKAECPHGFIEYFAAQTELKRQP